MLNSASNRYILTVRFGKQLVHGLRIYNREEAIDAKARLIDAGAKPSVIKIDTYESVFGEARPKSEVVKRAV